MTLRTATPLMPHVSDTAHWVAMYRAQETTRTDALFRDPFAARLAGERGTAILAGLPRALQRSWPLVVRTRIVDDVVLSSLARGVDRVINLAAGLDARPYRLDLPPSLVWVEADLPAMIDEKEAALKDDAPRCVLTRKRVDLADAGERAAFLDRALDGASRALVLTEGLLLYLDDRDVQSLARELAARSAVTSWITDAFSPAVFRMMKKSVGPFLSESASMRFAPGNGVAYFEALGWRAAEVHSLFRVALAAGRLPLWMRLLSFLPDPPADKPGHRPWAAVVRLERVSSRESPGSPPG